MPAYSLDSSYDDVALGFIAESRKNLAGALERIVHAVNQLDESDLWWRPHEGMNAIGNLMLHLSGNIGQWVTAGVGGEPFDRNRPAEFTERGPIPRKELVARLSMAVERADGAIANAADDLLAKRRIQGYDTTVLTAIYHAVTHFEGHAQEIVYIARTRLGNRYVFLWQPKSPEQASSS